jgi:hypothetical protein
MYHLFKVNDYKGGELSYETNLDKESLVETISEVFDTSEYKAFNLDQLTTAIREEMLSEDRNNLYADGQGVLFQTNEEDGSLMELEWVDFAEDIAKQLIEWRE